MPTPLCRRSSIWPEPVPTQLLADHTRVRDAAIGRREAKGYRIAVEPCLPVDLIGVTVLVPAQA